jgi:tetratricopeptide (TPR) repeat protein
METYEISLKERIESAYKLADEGRLDEAVQSLTKTLRDRPGSGPVSSSLCRLYIRKESGEIPKEVILNGLNHDPSLGRELIDFASRLFEGNALRESNSILEALVWNNPDNHEAWNDLGAVRFAMNDWVTAEKAFEQALALQPGYGETILNLTAIYLQTARPDQALEMARRALDERCDAEREMMVQLAGLIGEVDSQEAAALLRASGDPS